MELQSAHIDTLRMVTASLAGVSGPEIQGGARDGGVDGMLVIAQVELVPVRSVAADDYTSTAEVVHLGLTRESALSLARQLAKAAARLPQV